MEHVEGSADALALLVAADNLEDRSLGLSVNGDEVMLIVNLDTIALSNLN
jgi:hypothetical protein